MALTCAVKNCSNGAYWLRKWKEELCDICGCLHGSKECSCNPPFRLFTFPTKKKNTERRERWKQLIGRQDGSKLWSPGKDTRVCSKHFVDHEPTVQNPLPTLDLGYVGAERRVKRIGHFVEPAPKTPRVIVKQLFPDSAAASVVTGDSATTEDPQIETVTSNSSVPWLLSFFAILAGLWVTVVADKKRIAALSAEIVNLKKEINRLKGLRYTEDILKTDDDVSFYTGLSSKSIFHKLHEFVSPYVNRRWTGVVSMVRNVRKFKKNPMRFGPGRKMTSKSEFLMTLMKLRLGLLNKDLAKRFNISETLCSRIFLAWLRACNIMFKPLIYMPDEETLISTKPERFRNLPDLNSIIDCTELFIETPKDLYLQSSTWSDYKHHNTIKLLIACAPNSHIVFISPGYTGRISDKALTLDCGFLDIVPAYKMIMADKGFNITTECAERNLSLYVPPGKRGQSQMPSACVQKTKHIANRRILIEQVIRRLKTFRILANEIPLSLIGHVDEMTTVCAAMCNFKAPIYKV